MNDKELKALQEAGFRGGLTIRQLRESLDAVSTQPGVYIVMRKLSEETPKFLTIGPVAPRKKKDQNLSKEKLETMWINGSSIMYIGQTTSQTLRKRISQYIKMGLGLAAGHWGGRAIWQLPDAEKLVFYWKQDENPAATEKKMLNDYMNFYGKLPFANLTMGL